MSTASGISNLAQALRDQHADTTIHDRGDRLLIEASTDRLYDLAVALTSDHGCEFADLAIEQHAEQDAEEDTASFTARYFFYADTGVLVEIVTASTNAELPAISDRIHAADWHEREAEDMFGIHFTGHPFMGDFILHDTVWPENVAPMRRGFDHGERVSEKGLGEDWQPPRLIDEPGLFAFPVGPIWSDYAESGLWILETPGEHIHQAHTRLFYKFRGVQKIAEGQSTGQALLLAERFSGSSAFAHGLAYCQALEKLAGCEVPARAQMLRVIVAEFERIRYHAMTIAELAGSTGLAVGKARGQDIEETLLRLSGEVFSHRYLFGLIAPGGLAWAPDDEALARLDHGLQAAAEELEQLERLLTASSSFLDRIEEMGGLSTEDAVRYGTLGPVARAADRTLDLRVSLPYGIYDRLKVTVAHETEGDGYARMRVFFSEIRVSAALIRDLLSRLEDGPFAAPFEVVPGAALGWVEAPAGATFHWLRVDEAGLIARWQVAAPSFRNWHAFQQVFDGAAFQDFPIIMASYGLSVAENDR
ncbi:MAG: NADH-quinone oxidoreductase subunit C [Salinisphaera sp.]|jgi:formate hydrogenlyase subunit 5|nr:NADH-quinone oxidoreductase subunit C [Salinisphaera sp.]